MTTQAEPSYPSVWSRLARVKFRQGWIDAGGVNTRFCQAGAAESPPLLLVHGMGSSWECYAANVGPLSKHFNVVAFDTIGNGFSDKPAIEYEFPAYAKHILDVVDAFGFERVSLVGLSVAGNYLAHFALKYPDRTDKLVLLGTLGVARPDTPISPEMETLMARSHAQRLQAVTDPTWDNVSPILDGLIHDPAKRIADFVALRQTVHRLPGMLETMQRVMAIMDMRAFGGRVLTAEQYAKISCPVLVTMGEFDNPKLRTDVEQLATLLPHATLVDVAGVGHWPQWEAPEAFNRTLTEFLLR